MTRIDAPQPVQPVVQQNSAAVATPPAPSASLSGLAAQLAATPPVDIDRVQQIRRAIEEGTFPLNPARVADQLIALRFDWLRDDAA